MVRKIAVLMPMFFFCLVIDNCKSPESPEEKKSHDLYRYNVEVTYSDVAEGDSTLPLYLYYGLWDLWGAFDHGFIEMTKIGEKKAICYLPKVLITESKHWVAIVDLNKRPSCYRGENIEVQGAYDQEISTFQYCTSLLFRMSKE